MGVSADGGHLLRTGVCCVIALFFASCVFAQTGTTSLHGLVTDKTNRAIAGAHVTLGDSQKGTERSAVTGSEGEYEFLALPPGTYRLRIQMANFRTFEQQNVQLLVNTPSTITTMLEVDLRAETVEVSAAAQRL